MPSQLLARIEAVLDASVARTINGLELEPRNDVPPVAAAALLNPAVQPPTNQHQHWLNDSLFGTVMNNIQSITLHGTSGWPSYASADNFRRVFDCTGDYRWRVPNPPAAPHWYSKRGIGPQYFVEPNGTIYTLIGPENLEGDARFTWHSNHMSRISLGIENADGGDEHAINPDADSRFSRLRRGAAATDPDLSGMRLFGLRHPGHSPDLNLVWFVMFPDYDGPGDIDDATHQLRGARYLGWRNTMFTERNYRSLARLCRFLLERNALPRNFPLQPYASSLHDTGNAALFREMLMADPLFEQIAAQLGLHPTDVRNNTFTYTSALWSRFFGINGKRPVTPCFRGIISHLINGHHPCPGPLFDWHRFAREVWDWWWYPFDFDLSAQVSPPPLATTQRAYRRARGTTPLVEYYFDVQDGTQGGAEYDNRKIPLVPFEQFMLAQNTPLYAMANGIAVAARLPPDDSPDAGFLLTRHEIFHSGQVEHIDYDIAPSPVWSLITFLSCDGFTPTQRTPSNPDWLNRFVIRLKECELAVQFNAGTPLPAHFADAWNHQPAGAATRLSTGDSITRDEPVYRVLGNRLVAGLHVHFPRENAAGAATPVNVLLGDYLGTPGRMDGAAGGARGVQIEIFSLEQLPVPGAEHGTVSALGEQWWRETTSPARSEADPAAQLPPNGLVWRYSMTAFLRWLNDVTWASEWPKYQAVDAATNQPVPRPPRPNSRTRF